MEKLNQLRWYFHAKKILLMEFLHFFWGKILTFFRRKYEQWKNIFNSKTLLNTQEIVQQELYFFLMILFCWILFLYGIYYLLYQNILDLLIVSNQDFLIIVHSSNILEKMLWFFAFVTVLILIMKVLIYLYNKLLQNLYRFLTNLTIIIFLIVIIFFNVSFFLSFLLFSFFFIAFYILVFYNEVIKSFAVLKKTWTSLLISDEPIDNLKADKLDMESRAQLFYKLIENQNSIDNQVYWLIAEWWVWKSSFINVLKSDEIHKNKNILFVDFAPWYYESEKELLEKLLWEITSKIDIIDPCSPSIEKDFSKLIYLLDEHSSNWFWFKTYFSLFFWKEKSLSSIRDKINKKLEKINKKLVIIVDDLDRVSATKLIEILKIVDLGRNFYNTSFVLCYDPQNFNIVDDSLIRTTRTKSNKIDHIESQSFDNSELTRYMSKIITVYFPLEIDVWLVKNYFNVFVDSEELNFSENSKQQIKTSINRLFEYKTYNIWGKYYSDLRSIKRIFNQLLALKLDNSDIAYIFDEREEEGVIYFDILVRIIVLKLYHFHIYKVLRDEASLQMEFGIQYNQKYIVTLGYNPKEKTEWYDKFLNSLTIFEQNLFKDLIPPYSSENSYGDDIKKTEIRWYGWLESYFDLSKINQNSSRNSKINQMLWDILNGELKLLDKVVIDFEIKWLDYALKRIPILLNNKQDSSDKKKITAQIIDHIIQMEQLYTFDYDTSYYLNIAYILNASIRSNKKSPVQHIQNYMYGKWGYKEPLYVKIFNRWEELGEQEKVKWLQEWLRLLFTVDEWRGAGFYNYDRAVWKDTLYKWIYWEFQKRYMTSKQNFIEYIYDFEKKNNKEILWHLLYMLLNYASNDAKQELTKYFIDWFKLKHEYFLRWIVRELREQSSNEKPFLDMNTIIEYFDTELISEYINEGYEDFIKWLNDNSDKEISVRIKRSWEGVKNMKYAEILILYEDCFYRWKLPKS